MPRGTVPRPRPMSLPPPTYSPSYSGTSSERPRQHVEQPLASAQRHSQRGLEPPKQRTTNRILGDYTLSKTLGAGSMGKVKLAHHNITGEKVCPIVFFAGAPAMQGHILLPRALSLGFKHLLLQSLSLSLNCPPSPVSGRVHSLMAVVRLHRSHCSSITLRILIGALIGLTFIRLPFFHPFSTFIFLSYSANHVSSPSRRFMVNECAYCHSRNIVFLPVASEGRLTPIATRPTHLMLCG
jgi:serine/threonine protein kinase